MHRVITNCPKNKQIDHKNHNGLDNRLCNLRICSQSENLRNGRSRKNSSSRFKGVSQYKPENRWQTYIWENGKNQYLGHFDNEIDAAIAYDVVAKELFGEFANCNFS